MIDKEIAGRTKEEWDMLIKLEGRERERCKILGRDFDELGEI